MEAGPRRVTGARWMEAAPAAWLQLLANDPAATPAHRPDVWEALAGVLPDARAGFIAVEDGQALAGGAPAIVVRRGPFTWVQALPHLLSAAPLCASADRVDDVDRGVATTLAAEVARVRALGGLWACYRPCGPPVAPAALNAIAGETRVLDTAVVHVTDGIEAAWRRVDRKTRADIRHARAKLAFGESPGTLDEAHAMHRAQSHAWRHHRPMPLALSRRLLTGAADAPGRMFAVHEGQRLLAAAFALDHPRETLVWWSGAHPDARRTHAYALLLWGIVEWGAAAGRARVNLGASGGLEAVAAFKRSLGAVVIESPVRWFGAGAAGPGGRALAATQAWWRRDRHRGTAR